MIFFNILIFIFVGVLLLVILIPLFIVRLFSGKAKGFVRRDPTERGSSYRPRGKREGEVSIQGENPSSEDKIVGDNIGEYVDFEEVEEHK